VPESHIDFARVLDQALVRQQSPANFKRARREGASMHGAVLARGQPPPRQCLKGKEPGGQKIDDPAHHPARWRVLRARR